VNRASIPLRASQTIRTAIAATVVVAGVAGAASAVAQSKNEPIHPIVPAKITQPAKVELGKKLFFDPRLSKSGFISCNSCHNLSMGGTDNLPTSIGHRWQQGPINSPTVLNSSLSFVQFWDGRAKDLQEQAGGPIENPLEMAFTHDLTIEVLSSIPQYREEFAKVYPNKKLDISLVTDAIAEFEKTLKTPNSRFDQWLKGKKNAITAEELKGYELFKNSGCVACHNGEGVGGDSYQKMGAVEPYKTSNPSMGRADVTKNDADRFFFKTPMLRNVELTYPYFHDGAVNTLEEAVDIMGRLQLDKAFTKEEIAQIVAFLKTLTGDQPKLQLPILPPSQNNTPRPKPFN